MTPEIKAMLDEKEHPENIQKLLDYLNKVLKKSRGGMSQYYKKWDRNLEVYKGNRELDEEDEEAIDQNEPIKSIVPMSFAQIQTFVSFAFLLLTQNETFYQFTATGDEDYELKEACEKLIERDLKHNRWTSKLYQFLLDFARFGVGITMEYWDEEKMWVDVPVEGVTQDVDGLTAIQGPSTRTVEATKFEGNKIENVSPYHFLPDLRLPLTRWREGQFCGHECEYNISQLKDKEKAGVVTNIDGVGTMDATCWKERGETRLPGISKAMGAGAKNNDDDFIVVETTVQVKLIPADYGLGPDKNYRWYVVRIANDNRIISIDQAGYLHGEFIYNVAQMSPDMHSKINESLSDVIHALQDVVTWLFNSRILNVRNSLDTRGIMDPSVVDMADVESRSPFIKLLKGAPRTGIDKFYQQLKVNDTTAGHFADADVVMSIMRTVTGVNENAMGQYAPGRRSATENRAANAGAASRMKMQVMIGWSDALEPQGRKLLVNQRQGMSVETFIKVLGPAKVALFDQFSPESPLDLVGNEDFFVFDATQQSEKGFLAQSLQELIVTMISNPEVLMATGFDLQAAVKELQYLRGLNNATRFFRTPNPAIAATNPPGAQAGASALPVPGLPGVGAPTLPAPAQTVA